MRSLFDVNVLIALLDAAHVHHARATQWLGENIRHGWASCPLTQNGCIRILAQPNYPNSVPAVQAAARLREAVRLSLGPVAETAFDYVLVGRPAAQSLGFEKLQSDLISAVTRLNAKAAHSKMEMP